MENAAVAAAREISRLSVELRHETEANRRVADPIVEQLRKSRLARMTIVASLGGLESSPREMLEVFETLSGSEASVGWVTWNNALPSLFSRYLSPPARAEIFADPDWFYANSTRPSGKAALEGDRYRVNGRWALVSGCELAEWVALMCIVEERGKVKKLASGAPEVRLIFVRKGAYEIIDTWHVGGLRGTGSHDVAVRDLLVPAEHALSPADAPTLERPIGRMPILVTLSSGFAAQALGIARAAIDTVVELGKTKITPDPMPDLRDRAASQQGVASHATAVGAARSHLHDCVANVWDKVVDRVPIAREDLSAIYSAAIHADEVSCKAVDAMYAIAGTAALYTDCSLERAHRDIHAMMRHMIAAPMWQEDAGRVVFGLEPTAPLYEI